MKRQERFDCRVAQVREPVELGAACLPKPRRRQVIRRNLGGLDYGE